MVKNKLGNLEIQVKVQYFKRNNLNIKLKIGLNELKKIVQCLFTYPDSFSREENSKSFQY